MEFERVKVKGKEVLLLGTAHVSSESVKQVKKVIESEKPDCIALELDRARFDQLSDETKWREMNVIQVIKSGKTYLLLFNLLLASMQRRIGESLGIKAGSEMLEAAKIAEEKGIPIILADRDIKVTMQRAVSKMSFFEKAKLLFHLTLYSFGFGENITAEKVEELKEKDTLSKVIEELSREFPSMKKVLVDERDTFIAKKILRVKEKKVLAVVGAGHIEGIKENLFQPKPIMETSQKKSFFRLSWLKFLLPALFIAVLLTGFYSRGIEFMATALLLWIAVNAVLSALAALIVKAHWKSILTAFCAAPFTSLHPALAAGWFAGIAEAGARPPRIMDFEDIQKIDSVKAMNKNRFSHILVVTAAVNLASTIATILSIYLIALMI